MRPRRNSLKHLLLVVHLRFRKNMISRICSKRYYTLSVCDSGDASSSESSQTLTMSSTFAISQNAFPGFAQNVTIRVPFAFPVMRRRRNSLKHLL